MCPGFTEDHSCIAAVQISLKLSRDYHERRDILAALQILYLKKYSLLSGNVVLIFGVSS